MEIIIWWVVIFVAYWLFKKISSAKGIVWAMIYNDDLWLKPYSKYDMELSKNIRGMGGKVHMSEIIVFKWYLMRNILWVLGTNDVYKMKALELNQKLDKAFFDGFWTELKKYSQEDLEMRLRHFYLSNIPMYIDIEELENMSDEELYNSIIIDDEIIENISELLLNWEMRQAGYINPLFTMQVWEYIRRNLYMNRILLRSITLNPEMLTR